MEIARAAVYPDKKCAGAGRSPPGLNSAAEQLFFFSGGSPEYLPAAPPYGRDLARARTHCSAVHGTSLQRPTPEPDLDRFRKADSPVARFSQIQIPGPLKLVAPHYIEDAGIVKRRRRVTT